mmetsp:Transcript_1280/g.927  ORF Transcript_1280/g.927 Transcript_1280/m.927 type:complete len:111 (+) Transcript_1280:2468-2800(+)
MNISIKQLENLIDSNENEHCEFKEAKDQFDSTKLTQYCVALANEGGGKLVLRITDKNPRKIVGTSAFPKLSKTKNQLLGQLHLRIEVDEIQHPAGPWLFWRFHHDLLEDR